jgi:multicomponent Na+:H+ antiporter subunit F
MESFYVFIMVVLLISVLMTLIRALKGPTSFDRILSVNAVGTTTVVAVAVMGFLKDRPDFLDLALVYAMVNFVATIAILRFVEKGDLG